jgi:archaellum component FlaF (FlaF/FlaG flagellin family)
VQFNRSYPTVNVRIYRKNEWLLKDAEYAKINADTNNTFKVGHNKFSDWTYDEFLKYASGSLWVTNQDSSIFIEETVVDAPIDEDYVVPEETAGVLLYGEEGGSLTVV